MKKSRKLNKSFRDKFKGLSKWLPLGIGVKRWILLSFFGVVLVIVGSSGLRSEDYWVVRSLDTTVLISGIILLILGIKRMLRSLIGAFLPSARDTEIGDLLYQRWQLGRGPKIVAIGGGTGLSVLLNGLKDYTSNITAIVTVADDGGSSGRLRQEFDILPPGDIRNCLVALADAPALMRELFQFRFDPGSELKGHNFGNLFITVMTRLTGDFDKAIKETSKVLALRGQVIPSTLDNVVLLAEHKDGTVTEGENRIPLARLPINKIYLRPSNPSATPEAIKAIAEAQVIILGPGSLYTSIIPNLLIKDITEALARSGAIKVYVCNIMTQPGETDNHKASNHIKVLIKHSHPRVLDYCIVNSGEVPKEIARRYGEDSSYPVSNDLEEIQAMGYRVVADDVAFVDDKVIRHNPSRLAKIILGFIEEI